MEPYLDLDKKDANGDCKSPSIKNKKTLEKTNFPDLTDNLFTINTEIDEKISEEFPLLDLSKIFFEMQFVTPKICNFTCSSYFEGKNKYKNLLKGIINEHGLFNEQKNPQLALFYYYISAFKDKEPLSLFYLYHLHFYNLIPDYSNSYSQSNIEIFDSIDQKTQRKKKINLNKPSLFYSSLDSEFIEKIEQIISNFNIIEKPELDYAKTRLGCNDLDCIEIIVNNFVNSFYNKRNRDYEIFFLICSVAFLPPSTIYFKDYYKTINPIYTTALHLDLEDKELEKFTKLINKILLIKSNNNELKLDYDNNNPNSCSEEFCLSLLPFNEFEIYFIKSIFEFTFHNGDSDVHKPCSYYSNQNYINKYDEKKLDLIKSINPSQEHKLSSFTTNVNYNHYQKLEFLYKCEKNDFALAHLAFINGCSYYNFFNKNNFLNNVNNIVNTTDVVYDNYYFNLSLKYYEDLKTKFPALWIRFINENAFVYFNINDLNKATELSETGVKESNEKTYMILYDLLLMRIDKTLVFEGVVAIADKLAELLIYDIIYGGIYSLYDFFSLKKIITKHYNSNLSESHDFEKELFDLLVLKRENKIVWPLSENNSDTKAEFSFSLGYSIYWRASDQIKDYFRDLHIAENTEKELDKEKEKIQREYFNNAPNNPILLKKLNNKEENNSLKRNSNQLSEKEYSAFDHSHDSPIKKINTNLFQLQNEKQMFNYKPPNDYFSLKNDCYNYNNLYYNNKSNININQESNTYTFIMNHNQQKIVKGNEAIKNLVQKEEDCQNNLNIVSKNNQERKLSNIIDSLNDVNNNKAFNLNEKTSTQVDSHKISNTNNTNLPNSYQINKNTNSNTNTINNITNSQLDEYSYDKDLLIGKPKINQIELNQLFIPQNYSKEEALNDLEEQNSISETDEIDNNLDNQENSLQEDDDEYEDDEDNIPSLNKLEIYNAVSVSSISSSNSIHMNDTNCTGVKGVDYRVKNSKRFESGNSVENSLKNVSSLSNILSGSFQNNNSNYNNNNSNISQEGSSVVKTRLHSNKYSNKHKNPYCSITSNKQLYVNATKVIKLNSEKKRLEELKSQLISKFNQCIDLFNESNQISKTFSYRRFILCFIYKTYSKIFQLKPNSESCKKLLARSAEDLYITFKQTLKNSHLEHLSSSFLYHLGTILINGVGMKNKQEEQGLGYLQLAKYSSFKFLGNGSILCYFRKYKIDKILNKNSRFLEIKKELNQIKLSKGIELDKEPALNLFSTKFANDFSIETNEKKDRFEKSKESKGIKLANLNETDFSNKKYSFQSTHKQHSQCENTDNCDICDICFTEKKTTVFFPCKHAVCCLSCALKLIYQRSCPLCRGSITLFG